MWSPQRVVLTFGEERFVRDDPLLIHVDLDISVHLIGEREDVLGVGVETRHDVVQSQFALIDGSQQKGKHRLETGET